MASKVLQATIGKNIGNRDNPLFPPANDVWDKVMFSQACVIPSAHRGVGFPACITGHMTGGSAFMGSLYLGGLPPGRGFGQTPIPEIHGVLRDTVNK